MTQRQHIKLSITATWFSFLVGTVILIAFLITNNEIFYPIGLIYILITGFVNSIIFIILFITFITSVKLKIKAFLFTILPFINLPIAMIYCAIALNFNY